tara:strand:- start:124684 stop:125637 length:954 start_codon:yes stop_codon:yes gene_type:complete
MAREVKMNKIKFAMTLTAALILCACNSDDATDKGELTIAISDAPMSGVNEVGMVLDQLVVKNQQGEEQRITLQNREFNLLQYQGMERNLVLNKFQLKAGQYNDAYISIVQGDGNQGSYINNAQGRFALEAEEGKLPLRNFQVTANKNLEMTMEINLYKALTQQQDKFQLRHRGVWSVDNADMGHLRGDVDAQLIADCETTYVDLADNGIFEHLAYLYPAKVTELSMMADMGSTPPDGLTEPISVGPVFQDNLGDWHFTMGYLPAGDYHVGYTCLGHLDDPEADNITDGPFVIFKDAGAVTVEAGTTGGHLNIMDCKD